jgi:hypothetical protein
MSLLYKITTGAADLAKVQADPGEQFDLNKDAQTGLIVYAVMSTLKLVPTSYI